MTRTDLRRLQTELTRDLLLEALAAIVSEGGVHAFSVQQVADRAGVSHRTVYRHFPTREALLQALPSWLEARFAPRGGRALPESLAELPAVVRRNFEVFEEHAATIRALDALSDGANVLGPYRARRTAAFRDVARRELPHLPPEDVAAVAGVIRLLASSRAWRHLTEDHGVPTPAAGRAVAWALSLLIESLSAGGGPAPAHPSEEP